MLGLRECAQRQPPLRRVCHGQSVFTQRPVCTAGRAPWLPSAWGSRSSEQAVPGRGGCPRRSECHAGGSASPGLAPRFHVQLPPTPATCLSGVQLRRSPRWRTRLNAPRLPHLVAGFEWPANSGDGWESGGVSGPDTEISK